MSKRWDKEYGYTYADYLTWPEGERVELIEGHTCCMSAAPSRLHQKVLIELAAEFTTYLRGKTCEVNVAPFDVRLPIGGESPDNPSTVVQPDLSVVCDPNKLDERGCLGAPDLIVEVISPSSMKMDMAIKRALYERVGVREYWIVYPAEKVVVVYRLDDNGKYGEFESYSQADRLPVFILADFKIDLEVVFAQ